MTEEPAMPHAASTYDKHFQRVAEAAKASGIAAEAAESLIGIDACAFVWRRRVIKGELARRILDALDIGLEQSEFEGLTALSRLKFGIGGEPKPDATIGDVAEELSIDPSRASRLITALVQKGFVRRAIAQDDARKTVLILTDASLALLEAFMEMKWRVVANAFALWEDADIAAFSRLFAKYVETMREAVDHADIGGAMTGDHANKIRAAAAAELAARKQFA